VPDTIELKAVDGDIAVGAGEEGVLRRPVRLTGRLFAGEASHPPVGEGFGLWVWRLLGVRSTPFR